jgi:Ca-activated chloride channel family protein
MPLNVFDGFASKKMVKLKSVLLLIVLTLLVAAAAAQIKVSVQLINVVATVTDSRGRYVDNLKASDFTLMEDGSPQQISHFAYSNDLPVSVGIVLDTSISMERKISTATRAVDRFLRDIHADDDIFLMTFDQSVRVRQDFTSDRDKLWTALDKVRLGSGTSLYDGVVAGVEKLRKGKYQKKAILLISDGVDTASDRNEDDARIAVRESEMLVYALGIAPDTGTRAPMSEKPPPITTPFPVPGGNPFPFPFPLPGKRQFPGGGTTSANMDAVDMKVLDSFADASGGKAWLITTDNRRNRLQEVLDQIADELRNQYSIGYYPSHDLKDGKWHRIELRMKNPSYHVRYRQDYFGK